MQRAVWPLFEDADSEIKAGHNTKGFWTCLVTQRTMSGKSPLLPEGS